jgi:hypothetical protein
MSSEKNGITPDEDISVSHMNIHAVTDKKQLETIATSGRL